MGFDRPSKQGNRNRQRRDTREDENEVLDTTVRQPKTFALCKEYEQTNNSRVYDIYRRYA